MSHPRKLRFDPDNWSGLTDAEERTLILLVRLGEPGLIARRLGKSPYTISCRLASIRRKLNCHTNLHCALLYQAYRISQGRPTLIEPTPYAPEQSVAERAS